MARQWVLYRLTLLLLLSALAGCSSEQAASQAAAARAQVQQALRQPVSVDANDEPVDRVLARLADECGVAIDCDRKTLLLGNATLWRDGVPQATLQVQDIPLESALRLLLRPHDLAVVVHDNGLEVTTQDEADSRMTTEVYLVQDILANHRQEFNEADLGECITSLIEPANWEVVGGDGFIRDTPGAITVGHTAEVHTQIARLLDDIRRVADPQQVWPERMPPSAAEQAVRQALAARTTLDCTDMPFGKVLEQLRVQHGINIVIDTEELEESYSYSSAGGLTRMVQGPRALAAPPYEQIPITLHVADVPLESALNLLARQMEMDWLVRADVLFITSPEVAENSLETKVYSTARLLDDHWGLDADWLLEVVYSTIGSHLWDEVGGPCSLQVVPGGLAVTADRETHAELERFLADLERAIDPFALTPYHQELPSERQRIESLLGQPVTVGWFNRPLEQALRELAHEQGISNLIIDRPSLVDAGVGADVPISVAVSGISLRSLLNIILSQHELTWIVRDGVLHIITREQADSQSEYCIYNVAHLLGDPAFEPDFDAVIEVITSQIEPSAWSEGSGPNQDCVPIPGGLVIRQTQEVHAQIQELLDGMSWLADPKRFPPPKAGRTPAVVKLQQALAASVSVDAKDKPLADVLDGLARENGIDNLVLDAKALDDFGFDPQTTVSIRLNNLSLASALDLLLGQLDLTWLVENEVLLVTTQERADNTLETRCYPVPVMPDDLPDTDVDGIVQVIQRGVDPHSWDEVGGPGSITAVTGGLVVSQTRDVHRQLERLFRDLRPYFPEIASSLPASEQPESEQRFEAALMSLSGVKLDVLPLGHVLDDLAERHGMIMVQDVKAQLLAIAGRQCSQAVLQQAAAEPVAVALDTLLTPHGLTWVKHHECVQVWTWDTAEFIEFSCVHDVRALLALDGPLSADQLANFMAFAHEEKSWSPLAGSHPVPLRGALVIYGNRRVHDRWQRLVDAPHAAIERLAALAAAADDDTATELLRAALNDEIPLVRWYAWYRLTKSPDLARRLLHEVATGLTDRDARLRWLATDILGRLGPAAAAMAPQIAARLEDDDWDVQLRAVRALGEIGPTAGTAIPQLAAALERDSRLEDAVYEAFGEIGAAAVPTLAEHVRSLHYQRFQDACEVLIQLGPAAADATPVLMEVLESESSLHRTTLCQVLAAIGPAAREAAPALIHVLSDVNIYSRVVACEALPAIAADPAVAVPALVKMLAAPESEVRAAACTALGEFGVAASAAIESVQAARSDPDRDVQAAATDALALIEGHKE